MTRIIEAIATGVGSTIGFLADHGILFALFALLWIAFGFGLVASQGSIDAAWQWLRQLPMLAQAVIWLLFLPVAAGLWVWETAWPFIVRLTLVGSLAAWALLVLLPRSATNAQP